ncbi:ferrochelatase-domain-containing protein [Jaminaea rosea]|uniref:Ferrochelatase, mitochondrial n=1 Tax=Jaminaea rosea TaxID=1569628 RepID=A0A316UYY3_9BASI|nr:ferrochelatase-domain-containing protein [Jaminaea rosea]PWN30527.1 ferrochelatase-domain-containing protein [Jaminaea rosea]
MTLLARSSPRAALAASSSSLTRSALSAATRRSLSSKAAPTLAPAATTSSSSSSSSRSATASSPLNAPTRSLATHATSSPSSSKGPTGVLLMNMGGPATLPEVGDFLSRLFHDRDLIQLPWQKRLAPLIAARRTPKIVEQYRKIGGGSPILRWSRLQGEEMCKLLDEIHPETAPHKPYVAFRYARPLTEEALDEMARDGVQRAVAFTQYPQYSCSTTGSNLNELYREIMRRQERGAPEGNIEWSVIDRWPTHEGLVEAFTQRVKDVLNTYDPSIRPTVPIMFSAHSLPMQIVSGRGDPYPAEVAATVNAVMGRLGWSNPYRVTWQSQVGPSAWLGPQTSDTVKGWAKQGYKDAVVVPIAFTQDHIETLYELDLELAEEAEEHGMKLKRAESLNDHPLFIKALADIAAAHLDSVYGGGVHDKTGEVAQTATTGQVFAWNQGRTSRQMQIRCPGCSNAVCGSQKAFFGQGQVGVGEDLMRGIGGQE